MNRKTFYLLKSKANLFSIFWALIFLNSFCVWGQKPLNPIKDNGPKSMIELVRADSLVGDNSLSRTQTFLGNVIFIHRGVKLGCQKAIHNQSSNFIEAYGKIVINQGDTLTIVGDTLLYDGNLRFAKVYGKQVILRDKKVTLRTTKMFYDLNRDQAYYPVPGVLNQDSSRLSSKEGYYNTKTKYFRFNGDVEILNPSYTLCTDSLDYDTYTKQAIFKTFTTIKSKNGDISAYKGRYNIKTKVSAFQGRAKVTNTDYSLEGDTLQFDNTKGSGNADGNVVFVSFKDSLVVVGEKGLRFGDKGLTKIIGNTISQRVSKKDTLLIASDTLWVFEKLKNTTIDSNNISKNIAKNDSTKVKSQVLIEKQAKLKELEKPVPMVVKADTTSNKTPTSKDVEKIIADGKVEVYRTDFQSLSDSLVYNLKDSLIHFYTKPVIWNQENQLEADTIVITLKNNRLKLMELIQNSFVVQVDTIRNFNQIKGRKIDAVFDNQSVLQTIKVEGNGESKYFALDEKNRIIGLNTVQCSSMQFYFKTKKIKSIVFRGKPESTLIPPKEIAIDDMKLDRFEWKTNKKPSKESFYAKKFGNLLRNSKLIII